MAFCGPGALDGKESDQLMGFTGKKILVFIDWFEPGFKAGGPITSAVNFVYHLKSELDIYIFTTDRDLGDKEPYPGIVVDQWIQKEGFQIFYASPGFLRWRNIQKLIRNNDPDFLYLNSMFSRFFSIYPLLMSKIGRVKGKVVLAPRGMLRGSALRLKSAKKDIFLSLANFFRLYKRVRFQVTDEQEMQDVKRIFGQHKDCVFGGNLPGSQEDYIGPAEKEENSVSIVFIGRVHPIKNLYYLLECIRDARSKIDLTIVAPIEDVIYWSKCVKIMNSFPQRVRVTHLQDVHHDMITPIILNNHILALPTAGENFGHAIFESFAAGRPVLISDQTPWRNLERNLAGWDIPLKQKKRFISIIDRVGAMDSASLDEWCRGAWKYGQAYLERKELKEDYNKLFS